MRKPYQAIDDGPALSRRDALKLAGAAGLGLLLSGCATGRRGSSGRVPEVILHNARITTLDPANPEAQAVAMAGGQFVAVGSDARILPMAGPSTQVINAGGQRVIPGLNDSHLHIIRGGLNFNLELSWIGVPSLADAMRMLREQARRTPPGQWVRVVGGFSEWQFAERRLPTLDELNAAAPDTPVFILHLYDRALLNRAALRAVGYTRQTPDPIGGIIERDKAGHPTGLLVANPNAYILYKTLSLGPKLPFEHQVNSTQHFMREMNRLGLTSCCDAGGGFQNWPQDYQVVQDLHRQGKLTVRIAYNLFTQRPKAEREDFANWISSNTIGQGDDFFRLNGAGEMLVYSAADFEDFRVERPDMPAMMEDDLRGVVTLLAQNRWPFRMHATYEQTITRALNVFEQVNREVPLSGLRWFLDHCETIGDANIDRIAALGGGIAVQHRMAFQGEDFVSRYGAQAAARTPPIRRMLDRGLPVGAGTDATRVASHNPWTTLHWLTTGQTVGGLSLYPDENLLSREEALRLMTRGSAWFSGQEQRQGSIAVGRMADIAVLSDDYFRVPDERIRTIESELTVVGGRVVFASGRFAPFDPPMPPVLPEWSPVVRYGGHYRQTQRHHPVPTAVLAPECGHASHPVGLRTLGADGWHGCSCAVF